MKLGVNGAAIRDFVEAIEGDSRALIKEISTLSVWSEIDPNSLWHMTFIERQVLAEAVKEKTEVLYGKKGIARR